MSRSVRVGYDAVKKVIEQKDFIDYIKDNYENKHTASVDVSLVINHFSGSAVARPVISEVYKAGNKKSISGVLIELNNQLYSINSGKYIDTPKGELMYLKSEEDLENNIRLSPSDNYKDLLEFVRQRAIDIVLGDIK